MLTSRSFRAFKVLQLSAANKFQSELYKFPNASQQYRCKCTCMKVSLKPPFKQGLSPQTVGVRSLSSAKGNGRSKDPSEEFLANPLVDPDVGDVIDVEPEPQPRKKSGLKVKVKFDWKNSLVSADAFNLMENLYQTHPQLVEFDEADLIEYLQRISVYSIDVEKAAKIVIMNPRLLKIKEGDIAGIVNALRSMGLNETQRGHVLRSVPEIFNFPPKKVVEQFTFLKTYFSKQETVDVLSKSVEIVLEPEHILRPKLDYLIKDMSHETRNIVTCKALSYSLRHIKTRHEFLIRCGLFVPIPYRKLIKVLEKEYRDKNKPRNKYFKPIEVVCYKDEDFLKFCTKNLLTLNEYAAFEELYGAELDVLEEMDEEDDEEMIGLLDDDEEFRDAVSLVKAPNSVGFFSDVEAKSCYF